MEDRIAVVSESTSYTQHQLAIYFDGVRMLAVDNSFYPGLGQSPRPHLGTYQDYMAHSLKDAAPGLKVWFVQRSLRFTNGPVGDDFERRYDAQLASVSRRLKTPVDRIEVEPQPESRWERQR